MIFYLQYASASGVVATLRVGMSPRVVSSLFLVFVSLIYVKYCASSYLFGYRVVISAQQAVAGK